MLGHLGADEGHGSTTETGAAAHSFGSATGGACCRRASLCIYHSMLLHSLTFMDVARRDLFEPRLLQEFENWT